MLFIVAWDAVLALRNVIVFLQIIAIADSLIFMRVVSKTVRTVVLFRFIQWNLAQS